MIGFIVVFGTKDLARRNRPADYPCPACGAPGALDICERRRWFTLFFVPVVPLGAPQPYLECRSCGGQFAMRAS